MYPITTFTALTVCGMKDNALKFEDNHVSFRAMLNIQSSKNRPVYTFNAFDSVMERIKKMKVGYHSEVSIVAELRDFIDKNNNRQYSFTILSIDYLRTDKSLTTKTTKEDSKESDGPIKSNEVQSSIPNDTVQNAAEAQPQKEPEKQVMPQEEGYFDIEAFTLMYAGD